MKSWVSRGIAPLVLISALVVGEWSASLAGRYTPGEGVSFTNWIGGWVGPRAGLDAVEKIAVVNRTPAVQPVARRYTRLLVSFVLLIKFIYFLI
jgi:hypothetical protein